MSRYSIILLILTLLWLYLGLKIFFCDYRSRLTLLFSMLCLTMLTGSFFTALVYSQEIPENAGVYINAACAGVLFFYPVNLHFVLFAGKTGIKSRYAVLLYLPVPAILILNSGFVSASGGIMKYNNNWSYIIDKNSLLMNVDIAYILVYMALTFLVLFLWNRRTVINKEKIHSLILMVVFSFSGIPAMLLAVILPMWGMTEFRFTGIVFFYMYAAGLLILVSEFRFLNPENSLKVDDIIANISDLVFIMDNDLRILKAYRNNDPSFQKAAGRIHDRLYLDIVADNHKIKDKITELCEGRIGNFSLTVNYIIHPGHILTKTHFSRIKDRFGDWIGYIAISHEVKEVRHFQKRFKVTNREMEIVAMSVSGMSYRDVASALSISERTVERHLTNIYNKTCINNKIDLYRMAEEYNIRV